MTNSLSLRALPAILGGHRFRIFVGVIALLAFTARLVFVVRGQGLHGMGSYDDGVYYASAAALAAGRLPYRDFLLLQPPLLEIVLLPFAWAARLIGDANAFVAARLAFMAIGALNTALIAVVLRRFGTGAAVVGALFYALFPPAIYGERSTLLEPLGTLGLLIALALLGRGGWSRPRLIAFLAGVALAAAVGAKLWYVLPVVVVLVAFWRKAMFALIGAVAGGLAIFLPFFVAAPAAMWRELVLDQLGRPADTKATVAVRLRSILGAPDLTLSGRLPWLNPTTVGLGMGVVCIALALICVTVKGGRVFAVMFVVDLVLLLRSPSYFGHYAALTAPPLALVLGVAAARIARWLREPARRSAFYAATAVTTVLGTVLFLGTTGYGVSHDPRPPAAALARAAAPVTGCVTADDPTILALMGRLTPDLARGCPLWPDTSGYTYDRDYAAVNGKSVPRAQNVRWQRDILRYLTRGDATLAIRAGTGLSPASKAVLDGGTVLYQKGTFVLRSVPHAVRQEAAK